MNLYGQEPEAQLLGAFVRLIGGDCVIDVGAERGAFAEEMLRAGSGEVYAIDAEPDNVAFLREHFRDDGRISVLGAAISDADGELELHKSVDPSGGALTFGHTVLQRPDTDEIAWRETLMVPARSLASLIATGELPARAAVLKIDTEGNDFAVVTGMGDLDADVVMVEHWLDLPKSLGPCPWTTEQMAAALRPRGFSHFAFIVHREDFVIVQWDDGAVPVGAMGNLVFVHDRVLEQLTPAILTFASSLAGRAVDLGQKYSVAARKRLKVIEQLSQAPPPQPVSGRAARLRRRIRGRR